MSNNDAIVSVFYFGSDGGGIRNYRPGNYVHPKVMTPWTMSIWGLKKLFAQILQRRTGLADFHHHFYVEEPGPAGQHTLPCITAARSLNYNAYIRNTD